MFSRLLMKQVHAKACNEDKSVCKTDFHYISPPSAKKMVSAKSPDEILWTKYAKMRVLKKGQTGVTKLDIFDQFMTEQYLNQKEKSKFDAVEGPSSRGSKSFCDRCNNCTGYGHQSSFFFRQVFTTKSFKL